MGLYDIRIDIPEPLVSTKNSDDSWVPPTPWLGVEFSHLEGDTLRGYLMSWMIFGILLNPQCFWSKLEDSSGMLLCLPYVAVFECI
jgi:hypothetical protein